MDIIVVKRGNVGAFGLVSPAGACIIGGMNRNSNVILAGFMGTGKTAAGKRFAEKTGREFIDMDDLIVKREGKPVSRIFEEDGEPYFRSVEREIVKELSGQEGLVVGAGGGVVLNPDNISDFSRTGLVICLEADPEIILERLANDTSRPLLAGENKLDRIKSLMDSRKEYYASIPVTINTNDMTVDQVVTEIEKHIEAASD